MTLRSLRTALAIASFKDDFSGGVGFTSDDEQESHVRKGPRITTKQFFMAMSAEHPRRVRGSFGNPQVRGHSQPRSRYSG